MSASLESLVVLALVAGAAGFLVSRAVRLLRNRRGCASTGSPCCPATAAARDLRSAARRAAARIDARR